MFLAQLGWDMRVESCGACDGRCLHTTICCSKTQLPRHTQALLNMLHRATAVTAVPGQARLGRVCILRQPGRGALAKALPVGVKATSTTAEPISVWLSAREVESNVVLQLRPEGKGQAIIVADVQPGSESAQAGITKGQKLVGISDPVRDSQVWELGDRPSLRSIYYTLQMRRMGNIQLVLQDYLNATDPAWQETPAPPEPSPSPTPSPGVGNDNQNPTESLLDSLLSTSSVSEEEGTPEPMTVGERMAAQYAEKQKQSQVKTEVDKRMAKRAAYLDEVSQRNDAPMLGGLLLAFLLPPAIILAIAAGTGYLDRLYNSTLFH